MKKEIIISIIVITMVIIGNIVTQNNTKKTVAKLNEKLANLKTSLIDVIDDNKKKDENYLKYKEKSSDIRNRWDEMQELLSFYIEHDELEKVETQLAVINGQMESKLYDEAVVEIERCKFILEHIALKIYFKNIDLYRLCVFINNYLVTIFLKN